MCRAGGRRCPSHSDPVAIANRNARRRAAYQKNKGLKLPPETTHVGALTAPSVDPASFNSSLFREGWKGETNEQLHRKSSDATRVENLNITVTKTEGDLVDMGYFTATEVDGVIDYTNLDESSYLAFGFQEIKKNQPNPRSDFNDPEDDWKESPEALSRAELADLTKEESAAIMFFTGEDYKWVNSTLYGRNTLNPDSGEYTSTFKDGLYRGSEFGEDDYDEEYEDEGYVSLNQRQTPAFMKELTSLMDSALDKGPRRQRIVYRGMSSNNPVFGMKGEAGESPATRWMKENLSLGQEMAFDGYQSASMRNDISVNYAAGEGSLVFEILTSEGLNVTSDSHFPDENEVILPRDARYMVVGIHEKVQYGRAKKPLNVVQLVAISDEGAVLNSHTPHTPAPLTDKQLKTWGTGKV